MHILKYPEICYGPVPDRERAEKELADHPLLKTTKGAMDYLDLHLNRVEDLVPKLTDKSWSFWSVLQRVKAKKSFINTTLALRMIAVWHQDNQEFLAGMADRVEEKYLADPQGVLARHFHYVTFLLRKIAKIDQGKDF